MLRPEIRPISSGSTDRELLFNPRYVSPMSWPILDGSPEIPQLNRFLNHG
jgi:hypothetical protein